MSVRMPGGKGSEMIEGGEPSEGRNKKSQQLRACKQRPSVSGLCAALSMLLTESDLVSAKRGAKWVGPHDSLARAAAARVLGGNLKGNLIARRLTSSMCRQVAAASATGQLDDVGDSPAK